MFILDAQSHVTFSCQQLRKTISRFYLFVLFQDEESQEVYRAKYPVFMLVRQAGLLMPQEAAKVKRIRTLGPTNHEFGYNEQMSLCENH